MMIDRPSSHPQCRKAWPISRPAWWLALALVLVAVAPRAHAADGCTVLLCLAAPSWRQIPQCVPPVHAVLKDLAKGKPFPECSMSGAGNSAGHIWASAPANCPPHYTVVAHGESGPEHHCNYSGVVQVHINGALFTRTWWREDGDSVTEFSAAAKAQFGTWDTRFDDEYAAWLATQPPPPPANPI